MKLVINKIEAGGYIVSDVLNEFGATKPVFACANLGQALSHIGMKMDPPPKMAVSAAGWDANPAAASHTIKYLQAEILRVRADNCHLRERLARTPGPF